MCIRDRPLLGNNCRYLPTCSEYFIDCIKENNPKGLNCDISKGSIVAVNAHMGNIAFRTGKKIYWDKEKRSFNDIEADSFIRPKYHNGWKLPLI